MLILHHFRLCWQYSLAVHLLPITEKGQSWARVQQGWSPLKSAVVTTKNFKRKIKCQVGLHFSSFHTNSLKPFKYEYISFYLHVWLSLLYLDNYFSKLWKKSNILTVQISRKWEDLCVSKKKECNFFVIVQRMHIFLRYYNICCIIKIYAVRVHSSTVCNDTGWKMP